MALSIDSAMADRRAPAQQSSTLQVQISGDIHRALKLEAVRRGITLRQLVLDALTVAFPNLPPAH